MSLGSSKLDHSSSTLAYCDDMVTSVDTRVTRVILLDMIDSPPTQRNQRKLTGSLRCLVLYYWRVVGCRKISPIKSDLRQGHCQDIQHREERQ